jgi:hypothetical protein
VQPSVTLFHFEDTEIRIDIQAYFENGNLIIDGYDIGKKVKNYWGDNDYEYVLTIPSESIALLYTALNIAKPEKEALLNTLAVRFNTNTCYSDIRNFLEENKIPSSGFTWT